MTTTAATVRRCSACTTANELHTPWCPRPDEDEPAIGLTAAEVADAAANTWPATGDLVIVTDPTWEADTATYRITGRTPHGSIELTDTATGEAGVASAWQLAPAGD